MYRCNIYIYIFSFVDPPEASGSLSREFLWGGKKLKKRRILKEKY